MGSERLTAWGHLAASGRARLKPKSEPKPDLCECHSPWPQVNPSWVILTPCGVHGWLPAVTTPLLSSQKMVLENTDHCSQEQALQLAPAAPTALHCHHYCSAPAPRFHTHLLPSSPSQWPHTIVGIKSTALPCESYKLKVKKTPFRFYSLIQTQKCSLLCTLHVTFSILTIPSFTWPRWTQFKKIWERTHTVKNEAKIDTIIFQVKANVSIQIKKE